MVKSETLSLKVAIRNGLVFWIPVEVFGADASIYTHDHLVSIIFDQVKLVKLSI